ncbi:MAG TPA: hypothetical protein VFK05_09830 [Polyangiaceae bacterium]|nr:hypothetical protein [Polyangiaceae bacterium]
MRAFGFVPAFVLALGLAVSSCASTARITGDFSEYRSYREYRVSTTLEERLGAAERYLRAYPRGDYQEEVRTWYFPAEKRYFKLSWDTLPRLRAYLDAMPQGPHAEEVAERIGELESRRVFADRREQRMLNHAQDIETRLARAADQRRGFVREVSRLTELLGATRSFGEPTSELAPDLLVRLRERPPPLRCEDDLCQKVFSFSYAVPEDKSLTERTIDVRLQIRLERGLVQELSLAGPELLTRLAEAITVRAVPPLNPQASAEALGQSLEILHSALSAALPKERCEVEAVSPVLLERRCDGVRLQVVAGTEPGAADRLLVRRDGNDRAKKQGIKGAGK